MFNFNHPESADNAAALARVEASEKEIVVMEGLMLLAVPELLARADVSVFVELEADIRAVRRLERDVRTSRHGWPIDKMAAYYVEIVRVGHERYIEPSRKHAQLVLRGDAPIVDSLGSILALSEQHE
jgi:uridine kinase